MKLGSGSISRRDNSGWEGRLEPELEEEME